MEISSPSAPAISLPVFASNKANEVIISANYTGENGTHPVTYIADFDKMITNNEDEFN